MQVGQPTGRRETGTFAAIVMILRALKNPRRQDARGNVKSPAGQATHELNQRAYIGQAQISKNIVTLHEALQIIEAFQPKLRKP